MVSDRVVVIVGLRLSIYINSAAFLYITLMRNDVKM
jgi:hypothetical protein